MNDSNKSSNGLLVLKLSKPTTANVIDELTEVIAPIADKLGVEPMVLPPGVDVELKMGSEALLMRVCEALEKIAMSDQAPVIETQEGPSERPTLNARPGTLNERVVCRGDWQLGTACGKCERCDSTRPPPRKQTSV